MNKKLPHTLTEDELLSQLKDEANQTTIEAVDNDVLLFISTYNIQSGKDRVHKNILYRLYKNWSKEPVGVTKFGREIGLYLGSVGNWTYVNQNAIKLSKMAQEAFLKRKKVKTRSPHYKAQVERFMKECCISKGTFWLEAEILFDLYDEWCYSNNRSTQLTVQNLSALLKLYLKYKALKTGKVFAVNKSITKHISNERIRNIRNSRKKRNAQKTKKAEDTEKS